MNKPTKSFRELIVWQKAHQLVLTTYTITKGFPKEELFGLTSQMRRSSVSVAANIVEGYRKRGKADKARFLNISEASLDEFNYYFLLSNHLNYITAIDHERVEIQCQEVSKLLNAYSSTIRKSSNS